MCWPLIFIATMFSGELQPEEVLYTCFIIEGLDAHFQMLLIYLFSTKICIRLKYSKNKSEIRLNVPPYFLNGKKKEVIYENQ